MSDSIGSPSSRALKQAAGAVVAAGVALGSGAVQAQSMSAEETLKDVEATLGGVPTFITKLPRAALPGAWQEVKAMEFAGPTALDVKTKALISIAVGAQIPCEYCIWLDTNTAKQAGATDEEIAEAVTMAALTRHWSTVFHGLQVDFDQLKAELGGN
jgi:AhpD family alkylhydroperoxidase